MLFRSYLFMDELSKAVALFYPSTSGGGFNQPPAPSGDSAFFPISSTSENQEQPGPSEGPGRARRYFIRELLDDKSLNKSFRNACIKQEEIIQVITQLLQELNMQQQSKGAYPDGN